MRRLTVKTMPTKISREISKSHAIELFREWTKGRRQMELVVPLNPVPASRPRVSRHAGVYYLKTYSTWMKQAKLYLPQGEPAFPHQPVVVFAQHLVKRPKTTKLIAPRGDVDNYLKATLDAVTKCGSVWSDDDQVAVVIGTKEFTVEVPRTEILVVQLDWT